MIKLRELLRRVAKNPVLILALAILLTGIWVSYLSNTGGLPRVNSSAATVSGLPGDDVNLGSAATVQGVHTSQDPAGQKNQQDNLNGNSGGSAPLNVQPPAPQSSKPIIIETDPLPINPGGPCRYLLESPQALCHPICNPCGGNKMIMCPLEPNSQVRYPCNPCTNPVAGNIPCRIDGTPVGQL